MMTLRQGLLQIMLTLCLTMGIMTLRLEFAQSQVVYYTTEELETHTKPKTPGSEWKQATLETEDITLLKDQAIWFAVLNELDNSKFKHLVFRIGPWEDARHLAADGKAKGFSRDDDLGGGTDYVASEDGKKDALDRRVIWFRWDFQPKWERIKFKATRDLVKKKFEVLAGSMCADVKKRPKGLILNDALFGVPGEMIGHPLITEVLIFPESIQVDTGVTPTFSAGPETGNWNSSFVYIDPEGTPRPFGGVRWLSDGRGLAAGELFDLSFSMVGSADNEYKLYAFESVSADYLDFRVDVPGKIPSLSEWGLIIFGLLLLATIVWYLRKRKLAPVTISLFLLAFTLSFYFSSTL